MTNTLAIVLGATLVAALILDFVVNAGSASTFLARKGLALIEYVSFWR